MVSLLVCQVQEGCNRHTKSDTIKILADIRHFQCIPWVDSSSDWQTGRHNCHSTYCALHNDMQQKLLEV